jgi:hypothetical protein
MKGGGSSFISRNNDDPTAEATFKFMQRADISRKQTVIWNSIPGWNGTRHITRAELDVGMEELKELLPLLPKLRTIVLALNRCAVGSRSADREVARPRDYETRLLSTAFSMSAFTLIAIELRTSLHVSNVPTSGRRRNGIPPRLCDGVRRQFMTLKQSLNIVS